MVNPRLEVLLIGSAMEKLNLPFFYQIGHELNGIATLSLAEVTMGRVLMPFLSLQGTLTELFKGFPSLKVSKPVGERLGALIGEWFTSLSSNAFGTVDFTTPTPNDNYAFRSATNAIIQKAIEFQTVLNAELQSLVAYQVTPTGIYSISDLVENAEDVFPSSLKKKLSDDAIQEIRQSGRCLAFGVGTACGFHILRATEAVVHDYYTKICMQGNTCDKLESWGAYIASFRQAQDADAKRIAEMLQQVKDHDRNLIMHPEISLDDDEAHTLFELAKGAIMAMAEKL